MNTKIKAMRKMFFCSTLLFSLQAFAQDPFFTLQNYGLFNINPAYAGALTCGRAEMGYRLQWPALGASYTTFNAAYDQYWQYGGWGVQYTHDDAARVLKTDRVDLNYAYGFGIGTADDGKSKLVIQPGIQVSYYNKCIDWDKLSFGSQIDPRRGFVYNYAMQPGTTSRSNIDFSAGLLLNSKRICFGIAMFHLTEPDEGIMGASKLPMRFVAHGSFILGNADVDSSGFSIVPSFIFMQQQDLQQISAMVVCKYNSLRAGVGYRFRDAMLFSVGYTHNKKWTFSYSYDHTISDLGNTGGAHELHLSVLLFTEKWGPYLRNTQAFM